MKQVIGGVLSMLLGVVLVLLSLFFGSFLMFALGLAFFIAGVGTVCTA